jgi:hypothetical protein
VEQRTQNEAHKKEGRFTGDISTCEGVQCNPNVEKAGSLLSILCLGPLLYYPFFARINTVAIIPL